MADRRGGFGTRGPAPTAGGPPARGGAPGGFQRGGGRGGGRTEGGAPRQFAAGPPGAPGAPGQGARPDGRPQRQKEEKEWIPITKTGRLVKDGKIKRLEEIYRYAIPIKEFQIIDFFLGAALKDEVLKISPVQKQTRAGQRTRFKAFVAIGDSNGHVGLGVKCSKEVATAIRGAIIVAKLSIIPVRRGFWDVMKAEKPHTLPLKVTGKCGSVRIRLFPAPKGVGLVASNVPKKLLEMAGVVDCYTATKGKTSTLGNFARATYLALQKTYALLTPDLWAYDDLGKTPLDEHSVYLHNVANPKSQLKAWGH